MAEACLEQRVAVDEEQVRRDVNACVDLLADYLGVKMLPNMRPAVRVVKTGQSDLLETSFYDPSNNRINISEGNIGNGIAYFEEATHALRTIIFNKVGMNLQNLSVREETRYLQLKAGEEFCGRIGEALGRSLVHDSALERLFVGLPPRDHTNPKARAVISENTNLLNEIALDWDAVDSAYKAYRTALLSLAKHCADGQTPIKFAMEKYRALEKNLFDTIKLKCVGKPRDTVKDLAELLIGSFKAVRSNFELLKGRYAECALSNIRTHTHAAYCAILGDIVLPSQYEYLDYTHHVAGYVAAERALKKQGVEKDIKRLLSMPGEEIHSKYVAPSVLRKLYDFFDSVVTGVENPFKAVAS